MGGLEFSQLLGCLELDRVTKLLTGTIVVLHHFFVSRLWVLISPGQSGFSLFFADFLEPAAVLRLRNNAFLPFTVEIHGEIFYKIPFSFNSMILHNLFSPLFLELTLYVLSRLSLIGLSLENKVVVEGSGRR